MFIISIPASVLCADSNSLNPIEIAILLLMLRWSCSIILFKYGSSQKVVGFMAYAKNRCKPKEEEFHIPYASELCPKGFYFGIERFCRSVSASIVKIVEYVLIMNGHGSGYGIEAFKSRLPYFFIPFGSRYQSRSFIFCAVKYPR